MGPWKSTRRRPETREQAAPQLNLILQGPTTVSRGQRGTVGPQEIAACLAVSIRRSSTGGSRQRCSSSFQTRKRWAIFSLEFRPNSKRGWQETGTLAERTVSLDFRGAEFSFLSCHSAKKFGLVMSYNLSCA